MRALLVQGKSPPAYWSFGHSLPFIGKDATHPPLGLATMAAHLPATWDLRLRDLHLGPVSDSDLREADAVLASGMLVEVDSVREILARARALGRLTVVGGPAATVSPESFPEAQYLFRGEAEGRLDRLIEVLEHPTRGAERMLSPPDDVRPSLALARVPRFDLLEVHRYASMSVQVSRGCPFHCEFCDIIEMFGRVPRTKQPAQVLAELDALFALGARGGLFVVDDNFIGNRKAAAGLLTAISRWQEQHGWPFDLYTEASLDLAGEDGLVRGLVEAGFTSVFVGLESPDPDTLRKTQKKQNLRMDPARAVELLTRAGLEVFAGFIVGFDGDDGQAFARQEAFISALPVPRAMVGLLTALPGTQLWRRLEREGRLRADPTGDQFDRTNFQTTMPEAALVAAYRDLLAALFSSDGFFRRCELSLRMMPARPHPSNREGSLMALARAIWRIGVRGDPARRRWFWRLLRIAAAGGIPAVTRAVEFSIMGEHFIRYTAEEVLPRLERRLLEIRSEPARPERPPAAAAGA
ncbi:MAG TPA: DUF4070 domain-containing protein [Anaeromyxobacter sp.]|nr:DUF4070 domain-containing protein [Anaeromyxobacter sp.]HVP60382.1 DUF4070 domain-containing protein [Myxococcaceae bacterium]